MKASRPPGKPASWMVIKCSQFDSSVPAGEIEHIRANVHKGSPDISEIVIF